MTDALERTFAQLSAALASPNRLADTHETPFYTFVHEPSAARDLQRRLPKWRGILERAGFHVEVVSLRALLWDIVDAGGRWEDWLEAELPNEREESNLAMADVLTGGDDAFGGAPARPGFLDALAPRLAEQTPGRLVLLTDAAFLHPWVRVDKLGSALHDQIRCATVLFYPGTRRGPFSLQFLGIHPEDAGSRRTTILGGD